MWNNQSTLTGSANSTIACPSNSSLHFCVCWSMTLLKSIYISSALLYMNAIADGSVFTIYILYTFRGRKIDPEKGRQKLELHPKTIYFMIPQNYLIYIETSWQKKLKYQFTSISFILFFILISVSFFLTLYVNAFSIFIHINYFCSFLVFLNLYSFFFFSILIP